MSERISALQVAVGLTYGVYDRGFVVDWVASRVLESDHIEGPLLALCTLARLRDDEIVRELHALASDEPSSVPQAHLALACLGLMVASGETDLYAAIDHLHFIVPWDDDLFTEDERATVDRLEYGYELAEAQTYGTLDAVRLEFIEFTSRYRHLLVGLR